MMQHITEGIRILERQRIPFYVEGVQDERIVGLVRLPLNMTENLRQLGFRVGKEIFEGEKVVFYKGEFFGLTAG